MIALFAALQIEVQRFLRRLDVRDHARWGGFPLVVGEYGGRSLLVCRTGMGRQAAEAVEAVLARYRPEALLSVGLAGALSPELAAGELVFCQGVYRAEPEAEKGRSAQPVLSDARLLEAARGAADSLGLSNRTGGSLTTDGVVAGPQQKAELRQVTGLDVVEMESYWVGRAAEEAGVPFLAARVVFDGAGERVPHIPGVVTADGVRHGYRALAYMLRRPGDVPALLRLAVHERGAVGNLTRFLEGFVGAFRSSPVEQPA